MVAPNLLAYGVLAALLFGSGWVTNGWRWQARYADFESAVQQESSERAKAAQQALQDAHARHRAELEAVTRRNHEIIEALRSENADLAARAEQVRIVYREAVAHDPDCAAWAEENIRCPISWQSAEPLF